MFIYDDIIEIGITFKVVNIVTTKYESKQSKKRPTLIKRESKYPMARRHSYYGQLIKEIENGKIKQSFKMILNLPYLITSIQLIILSNFNILGTINIRN